MNSVLLPLIIGCLVCNVISQNNAECSEKPQCVPPGPQKDRKDIVDCFSTTQEEPLRNHWTYNEDCSEQTTENSYHCPSALPNGGQQSKALQTIDHNDGCDSGFREFWSDNGLTCEDPIWGGHDCSEGGSCSDNSGCFHDQVPQTSDDNSMGLCADQENNNANIYSDQLQTWGDTPFENDECF